MNKPELLGLEVETPDGRGEILVLHNNRVHINLHTIYPKQKMKGSQQGNGMCYAYFYDQVEIIKGQYNFK